MSKNRKVCWKYKKQVIQQPLKVPLENAVFKDLMYKEEKKIYLSRREISFVKQLVYKGNKPYKRYEDINPIQYRIIYSRYREDDLELGIRKAETLVKRRIRDLANNKSKWQILDNGDVLSTPPFCLSYHVCVQNKRSNIILKEKFYKATEYISTSKYVTLSSSVSIYNKFLDHIEGLLNNDDAKYCKISVIQEALRKDMKN
ncbi:hypothetical protein RhiirA4_483234 [Rhizophagus irregularis]|uniref:Uncharacterized protein n=1 Tax=Rhizophagus irregularis TaxID=588596 RepID=A0A2I1HMA6_9GLOM|nr:hypothetical protein RhiirA4_483234 [Rhizophagus irregularis]